MTIDPSQIVTFEKSIILSNNEGGNQTSNGTIGQLRFNQSTFKFEGYHSSNGSLLGDVWRPLTQDIASASNLGVIKVGTNLNINPTTGILSSISSGVSRFNQLVITVSPILGAADYQTINEAISSAIGTIAGGYLDGILTSNLGSSPSTTYPFVIQLGPGQYSETLNQIILPDYVSLYGEANYNSIINLNSGNSSIGSSSMIIVGENASIKNLVINLNDINTSNIVNGLYISNKSNVNIDNCIFTTSPECNTTEDSYFIWMENTDNTNCITNCKFNINSPLITSNISAIYIENAIPLIQNTKININTSNTKYYSGISLVNCLGLPSLSDIIILDNIEIYNNFENITSGSTNYGIHIINSSAIITNSIIECNNDLLISNNYSIILEGNTPVITSTSINVIGFSHYTTIGQLDRIMSNNIGVVNFTTLGFMRGQYISISGSDLNDGVYKIANVVSSSILELENNYKVINEFPSGSNTIILEALYNLDIKKNTINGSNNAIWNKDSNSRYIINLTNNIIQGLINITPSRILYTNYNTITVGKENCDYTLLSEAIYNIIDNSATNQYLIRINSGVYHEKNYIICKPYVNIEGNGIYNTVLQFYQAEDSLTIPSSNSSCFQLASYSRISNFKIVNSSVLNTSNSITSVIYSADTINPIEQVILDNLEIESICGSVYNYGIYLSNVSNITISNVNLIIQSNDNSITTPELNTGITIISGSNIICNNLNIIAESNLTNVNVGVNFTDSNATLNNITCIVNSGSNQNIGIQTYNTTMNENLIEIFNGIIKAENNVEYSIFADDYYTIVCNSVNIIGDTYTSPVSSRIISNSCYTFTSTSYNTSYQSLNSRGQNEQVLGTITIGDTAGNLGSVGINNTLIGVECGSNITTGSYNSAFGNNAGASITVSEHNTLIGNYAGAVIDDNYNTIIGSNAGSLLISGEENVLMGYNTCSNLSNGSLNVIIGSQSGLNLGSISNNNTLVGAHSLINNSNVSFGNTTLGYATGAFSNNSNFNVFIGAESGLYSNGDNNVLVGVKSGLFNESSNITAVGTSAGFNNGLGTKNTFVGFQSGYNTKGHCNTIIGNNAGYSNIITTASYNTIIGTEAGYSLIDGLRNICIGSVSNSISGVNDAPGWKLENGDDNIMIGVKAGFNATSAINNVIIGSNVGSNISIASNNILIGKDTGTSLNTIGQSVIIGTGAGVDNTIGNALMIGYNTGVKNVSTGAFAIGYSAGSNVSGDFNMFMGYNSGGLPKLNTTGAYNIAIGPYTGFNLTSGTRNVILGSGDSIESAGRLISTGSDNTLMGFKAGRALQLGSGNTLIGSNSGANLTNGLDNLLLGYKSGFNLNTGSYNVVLGSEAGYNLNIGSYNINAGYQSSYNNQSGNYNINVGYKSGYTSITNANNIHIGFEAGYDSIADDNIFIGTSSGVQNTTGTNNIFVGQNAGYGNNPNNQQIGNENIFMGTNAGNANENGYRNIFLGFESGKSSIGGSKNVFIGENTGSTGSTSHNIFIGSARDDNKGVGYLADANGEYNVFIGHDVGIANTIGNHNIFMGDSAGKNNTTGAQNIYIGINAGRDANSNTSDNNIAIGTDAGINNESGKENILIGKQVAGLSTSTNYNQNIIIGSDAGQNIQQDNQIFIGTNAGKNNTTGNRNIFIGLNAGTTNIDSQDNVIIGSDAGISFIGLSGLGDNVIIGSQAGRDLETGINNIFIGSNSGTNAISAQNSVAIGSNSMSVGDGSNVVIIGNQAGENNNADGIIAIGYLSGNKNTTGENNLYIGREAGYNTNVGFNNIMVGISAGYTNTYGENNIYVGYFAGASNTGNSNIAMGPGALALGSNTSFNICLGQEAGKNTNSDNNIAIGYQSGLSNVIGINNIMVGTQSGSLLNGYDDNIFMGSFSGQSSTGNTSVCIGSFAGQFKNGDDNLYIGNSSAYNSNGNVNIAIGSFAGYNNIGDNNIFMGTGSGYKNTANDNIFIGRFSGTNNTTGTNNIFFGDNSGISNTTGIRNIMFGVQSGSLLDGYDDNIFMGSYSGQSSNGHTSICIGTSAGQFKNGNDNLYIGNQVACNSNGNTNIAIGSFAGYDNTGNNNVFMGTQSGYKNKTDNNIFVGALTGRNNTIGINNMFFGGDSGFNNITGNSNIFLGYQSGFYNNANFNIFCGYKAGYDNITGDSNIFIGTNAGVKNTSGNSNIFLGQNSGQSNNTGGNNIFMGNESGNKNSNGIGNIFLGLQTGYNNVSGQSNIFMGFNAGYNSDSFFNIFMGSQTGYTNTTGNNNIFIGVQSGYNNITGINNTLIGYKSGYNNTSNTNTYIGNLVGQLNNGNNNFFLGYELTDNTGGTQTTYSNKFAIYQNTVSGITSNTSGTCNILIGGDFTTGTVGIGTIVPDDFSSGSFSTTATKFVVDGSILANAYNSFTGCHIIDLIPNITPRPGMIMSSTGKTIIHSHLNTIVQVNISTKYNDKTVYGVYVGYEIKNEKTYYYSASVGEGCILVCNINGEIQNGDYITSSPIHGYGALQTDDIMHSYTVAKCTQNIDWASITENIMCPIHGKMYKSILVSCTYHCG
jgi:hypothetical protein